jgi:hypothetical protein
MRNQAVSTFDMGSRASRLDSATGSPLACRQRVASGQYEKKAMAVAHRAWTGVNRNPDS